MKKPVINHCDLETVKHVTCKAEQISVVIDAAMENEIIWQFGWVIMASIDLWIKILSHDPSSALGE